MPLALALALAACQFRINPDFHHASADLSPPQATASGDLAPLSPPQDLATPTTPASSGDLALAPAAGDLGSPCTTVNETFAADPQAWTLAGDVTFDGAQAALQLTSLGYGVAGSAFYTRPLPSGPFDATFRFRMGDGSGADGMAFVVAKADAASALVPFGNGVVGDGYGLGYLGMNGFAVELDSFMNVGNGDPNSNHVSLVRTSDGHHEVNGTPGALALRSSGWRTAHVRFTGARLAVEIDGVVTIDAALPSDLALPTGNVFYGFTAASGVYDDRHLVGALTLVVGPAGVCF